MADSHGHGSHVCGINGAVNNNVLGVTGMSINASILACKAFDDYGNSVMSGFVDCFNWWV